MVKVEYALVWTDDYRFSSGHDPLPDYIWETF